MLSGFEKPTYVGIVFDIDDFKTNSDSALKQIKEMLVTFANKIGIYARIFVGGNEHLPKSHGQSIAQIMNYKIPRDNNNISDNFSDCVNGIGNQEDCKKYVIVLTNRFENNNIFNYKKGLMLNGFRNYDCEIIFFEIRRHNKNLMDLVEQHSQKYFFIEDISIFQNYLKEILTEIGYG